MEENVSTRLTDILVTAWLDTQEHTVNMVSTISTWVYLFYEGGGGGDIHRKLTSKLEKKINGLF